MPERIVKSSRSAPYTTLITRLNSRLKILDKINNPSMGSIAIPNRRPNSPYPPSANPNSCTFCRILDNRRSSCVDFIKRIASFNEDTGRQLLLCAPQSCQDRGRQRNVKLRKGVIVILNPLQALFLRILSKKHGRNQDKGHLGGFENLSR